LRLSVFTSRVAVRWFSILIASALLPVLIMASLSLYQVESTTTKQITSRLKQDSKLFGLSIYDRLLAIEDKLLFYTNITNHSQINTYIKNHDQAVISALAHLQNRTTVSMIYGSILHAPAFSETEYKHLREGKSVLSIIKTQDLIPTILMSRMLNPKREELGIITAQINQTYLWGDPDLLSHNTSLCIFGFNTSYLHCSQNPSNPIFKQINGEKQYNPISINRTINDGNYFIGRWLLFLKARYAQSEWTVILVQDKADALSRIQLFSTNYIIIILMTVLVVMLVSIYLIRKNTEPLEALMHGIRRISDNKFDTGVAVESSDEFGEVAAAFNHMSSKIGQQIKRLHTQADIDQLILSRPTVDDIINIAVDGIAQMISCEWVGIAIGHEKKSTSFEINGRRTEDKHARTVSSFTLSSQECQEVTTQNIIIDSETTKDFCIPLHLIPDTSCRCWLILPIMSMDESAALFIIGRNVKTSDEDIALLEEFSSRIAVAFSNAAWEDKLYQQAHFDHLTDLPNRLLLHDRLQQELNHIARTNESFAVLFMDLDRFKNVNDSIGHEYGDMLLRETAKRITNCVRQDDTVSRLGGDEFVILVRSLDSPDKSVATASFIAEKVISEVSKPILLNEHDIRITASIGIVICPTDGKNADTLLRNADSAMYHAKDMGRGNFQFYSEHLNEAAKHRMEMESKLRKALDQNEFLFHYQPKVDPATGAITSAEALLRWYDEEERIVYPDKYIHIAEEIGLTTNIGKWGLRIVCQQAKEWSKQLAKPFRVSINISARHFLHGDIVQHVRSALQETGLEPSSLELEITESTAMSNINRVVSIMHDLKNIGVVISIDDFGTGYSSLAYLKHFPVYALKIDRSFTNQILIDEKDMAIVKSTIVLAHNLELKVIAEGVESDKQSEALTAMECDELQGYLFSKPIPAAQFTEIIASGNLIGAKLLAFEKNRVI